MSDLISRRAALAELDKAAWGKDWDKALAAEMLKSLPSAQQWIPCSDRLPEDNSAVIVTWVNRNPSTYYSEVKDIPFTATAHYDSGKWWWDSCTCQEYLDEYHESPADDVHEDIEMLAWMPFPEPWKGGEE